MISDETSDSITRTNSELKRCLERGDVEGAIDAHGKLITALASLFGEMVRMGIPSPRIEFYMQPFQEEESRLGAGR